MCASELASRYPAPRLELGRLDGRWVDRICRARGPCSVGVCTRRLRPSGSIANGPLVHHPNGSPRAGTAKFRRGHTASSVASANRRWPATDVARPMGSPPSVCQTGSDRNDSIQAHEAKQTKQPTDGQAQQQTTCRGGCERGAFAYHDGQTEYRRLRWRTQLAAQQLTQLDQAHTGLSENENQCSTK